MEELIEKVDNLKKELDNTKIVKRIKELNESINLEKDLLKDIELNRLYPDDKVKLRIINNSFYREYKHEEVELNFLVLKINQRLKEISSKNKGCL